MSTKKFSVAVVFEVVAKDEQEAKDEVSKLVSKKQGIHAFFPAYEKDNIGQRVIYIPKPYVWSPKSPSK